VIKGYVKIRRGILEHLRSGKISYPEYSLYLHLIILADFRTESIENTSSVYIANEIGLHYNTVGKLIKSLIEKGYIIRSYYFGNRKRCKILINKYSDTKPILSHNESDSKKPVKKSLSHTKSDTNPSSITPKVISTPSSITLKVTNIKKDIRRYKKRGKKLPPPSLKTVSDFIKKKELKISAVRFWNYYNARQWKLTGGLPITEGESVESVIMSWIDIDYSKDKKIDSKADIQNIKIEINKNNNRIILMAGDISYLKEIIADPKDNGLNHKSLQDKKEDLKSKLKIVTSLKEKNRELTKLIGG